MPSRFTLLTASLLLGCSGPDDASDSLDTGLEPPSDPLEHALWRVEQVDAQLGEQLRMLVGDPYSVDQEELAAVEDLATVVETVADEDPRAIALLRAPEEACCWPEEDAPATDGVDDDDWALAPVVTKPTGRVAAHVDIAHVAAIVAGETLQVKITVDGELSDDVALGFYLDQGPGTLGDYQLLLWRQNGVLRGYASYWQGPVIGEQWLSVNPPSWFELEVRGSVAELALPVAEVAPSWGDGVMRVQAITYDVSTDAYDLAPYLALRWDPIHGPVQELYELALVADILADPSLAVASALAEAPLRLVVEPTLQAQVQADAAAWYAYGLGLPRLEGTTVWHKAAWSWRGLETTMYGALPLYALPWQLDDEGYAHNFLTVDQLTWWTALAESEGLLADDDLTTTVAAVEDWMDDKQDYRTYTEAMEAFCAKGWLDAELCEAWRKELAEGADYLGEVMGQPIYYYESSPGIQQQMWEERGAFYGDCGSHTAVVATILQSIGVPVAPGQYVADDGWVIHNFPIYLDAEAGLWRTYQLPCWVQYADDGAAFYQYIAPRHMEDMLSVEFSSAGDYGAGAIAYHHTTFGALCDRLGAGVAVEEMEEMLFERWWAEGL